MGRLGQRSSAVGRLGSGVGVSARLQIFALTTGANVLGGREIVRAAEVSGEYCLLVSVILHQSLHFAGI